MALPQVSFLETGERAQKRGGKEHTQRHNRCVSLQTKEMDDVRVTRGVVLKKRPPLTSDTLSLSLSQLSTLYAACVCATICWGQFDSKYKKHKTVPKQNKVLFIHSKSPSPRCVPVPGVAESMQSHKVSLQTHGLAVTNYFKLRTRYNLLKSQW